MDLTFLALCEADDISRVEGQANADNKQVVGLKPYQRKHPKDQPRSCLKKGKDKKKS